jgi:flagellar basal body-associated protein FliL
MRATTIAVCVIGAIVLFAAVGEGAARFTGARWNFNFSPPPQQHQRPPLTPLNTSSPAPVPTAGHGTPVWLIVVLWILVAAAVAALLWLLAKKLPRPRPKTAEAIADAGPLADDDTGVAFEDEVEPDAPAVRRGIAQALAILGSEREPGDAIVKAWLGLEESAEDAGINRRPAETPTEFTSRMLGRVTSDTSSVNTILRLYLRVRFGDHPASSSDVEQARTALQHLEESWRSEAKA